MIIKKDSALLIGNGINRTSNNNSSWETLLRDLFDKVTEKNKINIPKNIFTENNEISYPEIFDALFNLVSDDIQLSEKTEIKKKLRELLPEEISEAEVQSRYNKVLEFTKHYNLPILTTNYDNNFVIMDNTLRNSRYEKGIGYRPLFYSSATKPYPRYPYNCYFSNVKRKNNEFKVKLDNNLKQFSIWCIHGFAWYASSICIGAQDYGYSITKYSKMINNNKKGLYKKENKHIKIREDWEGKNTWLNIFLTVKNLYIIGLNLNSEETSLRWLLQERKKCMKIKYGTDFSTVYVTKKGDLKSPKAFYLKSLGIKIETVNNYQEMYDLEMEI